MLVGCLKELAQNISALHFTVSFVYLRVFVFCICVFVYFQCTCVLFWCEGVVKVLVGCLKELAQSRCCIKPETQPPHLNVWEGAH